MSIHYLRSIKQKAFWLCGLQVILVGIIALAAWIKYDLFTAYSLFIGGLVSILPNFYFARKFFKHTGARKAKEIVITIYRNEVIKLILMAIGFIIVVKFVNADLISVVIGFVIAQFVALFFPILFIFEKTR